VISIQKHIISEAFEQLSKSAKLNESKLPEAYIIEPKYRDGDVVFVGDASGYHGTFLIDGDFKKIPEELYHNIRRITKYSNLDKPYYKVEYKIDSDSLFEKDYQEFFNRIIPILRDVGISVLKSAEDITESKLTEAPMDVKDYAARLKARKAEKGQNPLEKINSQIDPDMSITDQLQVYFDELVPVQGKADTVAGELVRAMMRVLYRDYNDGDLFYSGYGKETCGGSVVYLMDKVEDLERPFSNIVENQYEDQYYTTELEDAAYILIEYLNNHPELFIQKNEEDSRNVDENRLEDYFSLPLYEFEPDTSYDESYYAVSDDDIDEFIRGVVSSDLSSGDVNRWARDGWTIVDLDKEDYDTLQDMWDRWFRDFLSDYERQEEDEYEDEEDFEESLTKDN